MQELLALSTLRGRCIPMAAKLRLIAVYDKNTPPRRPATGSGGRWTDPAEMATMRSARDALSSITTSRGITMAQRFLKIAVIYLLSNAKTTL